MQKMVINGKFLSQNITGVQRFAREIVVQLDALIDIQNIEIAIPSNAQNVPSFKKIKVKKLNVGKGILWEQIVLPIYLLSQNAVGLNLCHVAPILKPDVVCIHDANVKANPKNFPKILVLWYNLIHCICAKFAKHILTDSQFSVSELIKYFDIPQQKISCIYAGWQHFENVPTNENILEKYGLKQQTFFFSLGTLAPHKNIRWIYEAAKKNPEKIFILSGSSYSRVFGTVKKEVLPNVKFLGYLSDIEVKTLMKYSKAFIFPSLYEGFGLPPLEALSTGVKVIVSRIPCLTEILKDSVHYIDPFDYDVDLDRLLEQPISPANEILETYSWEKTTEKVFSVLQNVIGVK